MWWETLLSGLSKRHWGGGCWGGRKGGRKKPPHRENKEKSQVLAPVLQEEGDSWIFADFQDLTFGCQ